MSSPRTLAWPSTWAPAGTASVRHVATLVVVATLPLTYAMTVRVVFPLKIYELVLCLCAALMLWEGRVVVAPGLGRLASPIYWFLAWSACVIAVRLAIPLRDRKSVV